MATGSSSTTTGEQGKEAEGRTRRKAKPDRSIEPPAFERAFESYVPRNQRAAQKTTGARSGRERG